MKKRYIHNVILLIILSLVFLVPIQSLGSTTNLCAGLVVNKANYPMTALAKPAVGQAVTDPQFSTIIRRISNSGSSGVIKPLYSTIPAWNADETYLILYHQGSAPYAGSHVLYDGKTYRLIKALRLESPTDLEHIHWDPTDADVLYYPSNYNGQPRFMRYRVSTDQNELVRNFGNAPTNCPTGWSDLLSFGSDPQYMAWNASNKIVGLKCGNKKFAYNIGTNTVLGISDMDSVNAPIVAPSGNLMFLDGKVYDTATFTLQRTLAMANAGEHASIGKRNDGSDVYNVVSFDDAQPGSLVSYELATGTRKVVVGKVTGYPYPPSGTHISSVALRAPGYVAVSIVGGGKGQTLLDNEIVLADLNSGQICRVAHHRSLGKEGPQGYWAEPHATISPSGTRILFASDWGGQSSVDTYVVELPSYQP